MISIQSERNDCGSAFQRKGTTCLGGFAEAIPGVVYKSEVQTHPAPIL